MHENWEYILYLGFLKSNLFIFSLAGSLLLCGLSLVVVSKDYSSCSLGASDCRVSLVAARGL